MNTYICVLILVTLTITGSYSLQLELKVVEGRDSKAELSYAGPVNHHVKLPDWLCPLWLRIIKRCPKKKSPKRRPQFVIPSRPTTRRTNNPFTSPTSKPRTTRTTPISHTTKVNKPRPTLGIPPLPPLPHPIPSEKPKTTSVSTTSRTTTSSTTTTESSSCNIKKQHNKHTRVAFGGIKYKRSILPNLYWELNHENFERLGCQALANSYLLRKYPIIYIDGIRNRISDRRKYDVIYTTFEGYDYPLALQTMIAAEDISPIRTSFNERFNRQMENMHAYGYGIRRGVGAKDEKGHLLASQLGGPIAWYNLAPQTARLNRNLGNGGTDTWLQIENRIKRHLDFNCSHVDFTVVINFKTNPDGSLNVNDRRPIGFKLCVEMYDGDNNMEYEVVRYFRNI